MAVNSPLLTQLIDDYISWFAGWHRHALGNGQDAPEPPPRFIQWRSEAAKALTAEQPAIERLATLHEQLHKLVKLVLIKTDREKIARGDDASITEKYLELMQELRRFERAFALAASDLDPLTGLRTRLVLAQDLIREINRSARTERPFFAAVMDIDHFKNINDTYGHDGGDHVLAAIASHISRILRAHDDAYRLGGEEFFICLKETDAAGSMRALERLRSNLEQTPVALPDGRTVRVTASFGVTAYATGLTPDALMRKADEALYRAKHEGRNRVVVAS
jgi:diguanylate cyclase